MELSDTYLSVLETLRANPKGLITGEIVTHAKKHRMLLIRDVNQVSAIVNALRSKALITTRMTNEGRIHNITELGLKALADEPILTVSSVSSGILPVGAKILSVNPIIEETDKQAIEQEVGEIHQPTDTADMLESFDMAIAIIRDAMAQSLKPKQACIKDKDRKLATLEKLVGILHDEISVVLSEIIEDYKTMEDRDSLAADLKKQLTERNNEPKS